MSRFALVALIAVVAAGAYSLFLEVRTLGKPASSPVRGQEPPVTVHKSSEFRAPLERQVVNAAAADSAGMPAEAVPVEVGTELRVALSGPYASAREELDGIVAGVRRSGLTNEPWAQRAKERIFAWQRRWSERAHLGDVECHRDGCIAHVRTFDKDLVHSEGLAPLVPPDGWEGGLLQVAPYVDRNGETVTALVLVNPAIR